jgi:hypothetical protein
MEATTIRDLYIKRVREQEQKFAQKEINNIRQERQEEARMRQEEARMRQEAEKKMVAAIINWRLFIKVRSVSPPFFT